jgi:hypothetical protein
VIPISIPAAKKQANMTSANNVIKQIGKKPAAGVVDNGGLKGNIVRNNGGNQKGKGK